MLENCKIHGNCNFDKLDLTFFPRTEIAILSTYETIC